MLEPCQWNTKTVLFGGMRGKKANIVAGRLMEIDLFPRLFLYAAQFGVWQNFSIE